MKTAISIPDPIYETAEKLADQLGTSRSKLYTQALSSYIAAHLTDELTQCLNEVYDDAPVEVDQVLIELQRQSVFGEGGKDW